MLTPPPAPPLQPAGAHVVWITITVVTIAVDAIGWTLAIMGAARLDRDGYDRRITALLVLGVLLMPLAGFVMYLFARSNHRTRFQPVGG